MFEQITGGYVHAGYHEVMYTDATKEVVDKKLEENENGANNIMWRVSSTLFAALNHETDISPLPELEALYDKERVASGKYKKMTCYEKMMEELAAINLAPKTE